MSRQLKALVVLAAFALIQAAQFVASARAAAGPCAPGDIGC
jgi:hypothetical protein